MRKLLIQYCWVFLLVLLSVACSKSPAGSKMTQAASKPTVVYLVRHAEKETSDPSNQDPDLTAEGVARAEALLEVLNNQQVDALYATNYLRTKNTLVPLAKAKNLEIREYEAHDFSGLKNTIMQNNAGQTIVVAGHSNTVLPLAEAFGAKRPVPEITDAQYDYLFKVTVAPDGTATIETSNYGKTSR